MGAPGDLTTFHALSRLTGKTDSVSCHNKKAQHTHINFALRTAPVNS